MSSLNNTRVLLDWHTPPRHPSIPPSFPLMVNLHAVASLFRRNLRPVALCLDALVSLHSARQPDPYTAVHSITAPLSRSSADRNPLNGGPTCVLLLSRPQRSRRLPSGPLALIPFLFIRAGGLAPIFTSLPVLLAGDDSNNSKVLGEQQSQLTSCQRQR